MQERSRSRSPDSRNNRKLQRRKVEYPELSGPLLTYKQFMNLQGRYLSMNEAQEIYEKYKQAYERKQLETFFNEHKDEPWFRERYDPQLTAQLAQERIEASRKFQQSFV